MPKRHDIQRLAFEGETLVLETDGRCYRLPVAQVSPRLAGATEAQRRQFRLSPSGYGIHWPELDEDLSVDGLIRAAEGITGSPLPGLAPAAILNDKPNS